MTNTEHPALVALREVKNVHRQVFRYGMNRNSAVASMHEAADRALPALEALIAERDALRDALKGFVDLVSQDGHGFHDSTDMGRALKRGRAALAKGES